MKIIPIIVILILIIISIITLPNCICDKKIEQFSPERTLGVKPPMFVFYNGTRFFVKDVTPIFLENKEPIFYLTMQLTIPSYNNSILITVPDSNAKYAYEPFYPEEKNGSYNIDNLPISLSLKKGEYPYDYYIGNISFWDKNSDYANLFTYRVNKTYSSQEWKIVIFGDYNKLHFALYRIKEIAVFEILYKIGIIVLLVNLWIFIVYILSVLLKSIKSNLLILGNSLFYIGLSIGIPFYFGVIINNYLLANPFESSSNIGNLFVLVVSSVIFGAIGFVFKEEIKTSKK